MSPLDGKPNPVGDAWGKPLDGPTSGRGCLPLLMLGWRDDRGGTCPPAALLAILAAVGAARTFTTARRAWSHRPSRRGGRPRSGRPFT